jgi:hypothetical protein
MKVSAAPPPRSFAVKRGLFYQLGNFRHIKTNISFAIGGVPINAATNLSIDYDNARIQILPKAPQIADGSVLQVTFEYYSSSSAQVSPKPRLEVGSLRFISDNPVGKNISYFFPYVAISPTGELDTKADSWQRLAFTASIRKLNPLTEFFYALLHADPGLSSDETAIIDLSGLSLANFPIWDDALNPIVNVDIPSAIT